MTWNSDTDINYAFGLKSCMNLTYRF